MKRLLIPLLAVLVVAACSTAGAPSGTAGSAALSREVGGQPVPAPMADAAKGGNGATTAQNGVPIPQALDPTRAVIMTASMSMRSKDPWAIADRAQQVATGLGGDVLSLALSGSGDQRNAMLTIRVPSSRFNDALRQLRDLKDIEVLTSNVDSKDVTDQFVDLQARLTAKQSEEQRYLALLNRADKIDDILKIDSALSNVRMQIEQLTGQINSIKSRTEFSSISVQITPLVAIPVNDPVVYDPSRTVERAFATLVAFMRVIADVAIWLLVFAWIPLVALGAVLLAQRLRTRAVRA